ncbi:hypothetical protein [Rivihabitans pingtungensis]|nr:hypothetical protein [Rivihabitans pingtungensis]MCK6437735.1 hypothetical protein [Rivihabitans pingtungensis]
MASRMRHGAHHDKAAHTDCAFKKINKQSVAHSTLHSNPGEIPETGQA